MVGDIRAIQVAVLVAAVTPIGWYVLKLSTGVMNAKVSSLLLHQFSPWYCRVSIVVLSRLLFCAAMFFVTLLICKGVDLCLTLVGF